jgi:hypothetical protein
MVNNGFPPQSLEDSERLKQLKDIMREDGYSDDNLTNDDKISEAAAKYTSNSDDIESLMYFNAKFFKKCIKQRILPPKELYWRVRAVFVTFGDMGDADTNKPLFNDTAWKKADNILREILEGLYSRVAKYLGNGFSRTLFLKCQRSPEILNKLVNFVVNI